MHTRVSPAKTVINSDQAIAGRLMGAWLPRQESSALQWLARSKYRLKADDVSSPKISDPSAHFPKVRTNAVRSSNGEPSWRRTMDKRFIKLQREGGGPPSEVMINSSLVRYIEDVTVEGGPARARISFAADDKVVVSGTWNT
jgi:hypothetical protein